MLKNFFILTVYEIKMVRVKGVEPPRLAALDPKSSASANSATPAADKNIKLVCHEGLEPSTL